MSIRRRDFLKSCAIGGSLPLVLLMPGRNLSASEPQQPNILLCISDDQSYPHAGANGDPIIKTPAFDRVAREGIRFTLDFCDAPSCAPSRSAILTGQHIWRLEEGGNIHSTLPAKFTTYTEILEKAGYFVGSTGKAWSPGKLEPGGRDENPAGKRYISFRYDKGKLKGRPRPFGMSPNAYSQNFEDFLKKRPQGKPFCSSGLVLLSRTGATRGTSGRVKEKIHQR